MLSFQLVQIFWFHVLFQRHTHHIYHASGGILHRHHRLANPWQFTRSHWSSWQQFLTSPPQWTSTEPVEPILSWCNLWFYQGQTSLATIFLLMKQHLPIIFGPGLESRPGTNFPRFLQVLCGSMMDALRMHLGHFLILFPPRAGHIYP